MIFFSRKYEDFYSKFRDSDQKEVWKITGCKKPCYYKKYSFFGEPKKTHLNRTKDFLFSFFSHSNDTRVETETLIYPLSSLVTEFGGVLGLFLGFSFMALWDGFKEMVKTRDCRK